MISRTRVKICGITRSQDARLAASLGVDAIGLVFYEKSPRNVSIRQAQEICQSLPAFVSVVSLFMNPEPSLVENVLAECPVDQIQFHGTETAEFCGSFKHPYIKAMGMAGDASVEEMLDAYPEARGLLLDSHATGAAGGTGETFDWDNIPQKFRESIILAGGLNPDNVAEAIRRIKPYAVDLSSGVESSPGIKDADLVAKLMKQIQRVECEHI